MKTYRRKHDMESLFVLLSFGVFAVCVLAVLLTGANSYRVQVERNQQSWNRRTGLQYVSAKVRQMDSAAVDVTLSGGNGPWYDSLHLTEVVDGARYTTQVYYYDGAIRELYSEEGAVLEPEAGEKILEAKGLRFAWNAEGMLMVEATDSTGTVATAYLALRSGEGAAA